MNFCCNRRICTCELIGEKEWLGNALVVLLCVAVYLGAFAWAVWP